MHQSAFSEAPTNFILISFHCYFANFLSITKVLSKPKTKMIKYSSETILFTIALQRFRKLHAEIAGQIKILKLILTKMIH